MGWMRLFPIPFLGEPFVSIYFVVPRAFNDGTEVPAHSFDLVEKEMRRVFHGATVNFGKGFWEAGPTEDHIQYRLDFSSPARKKVKRYLHFFSVYQRVLRVRFEQDVIYMWIEGNPLGRRYISEYSVD